MVTEESKKFADPPFIVKTSHKDLRGLDFRLQKQNLILRCEILKLYLGHISKNRDHRSIAIWYGMSFVLHIYVCICTCGGGSWLWRYWTHSWQAHLGIYALLPQEMMITGRVSHDNIYVWGKDWSPPPLHSQGFEVSAY